MTDKRPVRRDRRHRVERIAANSAATLLAVAAFGSSLRHVQLVAATHGQAGWISWLISISVELVALVAISELSRARATGQPVPPAAVLALSAGLLMSAACNAATARGSGPWPFVMALWPVVAYGLVVLIIETRPGRSLAGLAETVIAKPAEPSRPAITDPHADDVMPTTSAPSTMAVTPAVDHSRPASGMDREQFVEDLTNRIRRDPHCDLTWATLHEETGMSKSWCEKTLAAARKRAHTPQLVKVSAR